MSNKSLSKSIDPVKQNKTPHERIEELHGVINTVVEQINAALKRIDTNLRERDDVFKGVVQILGTEAVAKAMLEVKQQEIEAEAAQKKANLMAALAEGKVVKSDKVSINTIIVGTEKTAEGGVVVPKESVVGAVALKEELQKLLMGQSVGFKVELPEANGNTFEILELYDAVKTEDKVDGASQ